MASKKWAIGTQLLRGNGDGPPETFTAIAAIESIGGPQLKTTMLDVTTLDSLSGFAEFIPTFKDGGEVPFTLIFEPDLTGHQKLLGDWVNKTLKNFELIFPSDTPITWTFAAYVSEYQVKIGSPKDALKADCKLRITGAPTLVTA